ncbi:SusF/SusE family outer membrane protein [Antarcticibacterium arcticum]|uniref:SusF/SusE family outer membrane protein n=1 Tax=Antarcticibacterium arcticum TaxID=2585771 RepID=A0A5B8YFT2_9FLAO|nr:SusF/SusE family outer membrane protein [Antarcticibacterium arcticum]QED36431.1 SusF/SusE family outer membrane protein [Antarcticibacterium arcticum]
MKKLSILLFAFVALTGLNSCTSDDDVVFIAQPDPEGISFINSFNANYVLTAATATNVAERFVWNTVDFDVPTNITYQLQGSTDANFGSFDVLGATGENNLAVTVRQLMTLAEDAGLDSDPNTDAPNSGMLYFRVRAFAGTDGGNGLSETSEVKSITVVLPETGEEEEVFKNLFLVGSATATGWDNSATSNNYPLFRDAADPNIYHYTGKLTGGADMFWKLVEVKGQWAPQYGGENGNLLYRATEGDTDPPAIAVSATGYYTITVNLDEMTYTVVPYDASGSTTYATIGIIGDSTPNGWDADQDMTKSEFDPHIWYIKGIELNDGEMKFRADNDWAVSWGGNTAMSGLATSDNGPNIPVSGGTYDIWFNDLTGRYIFIKL